MRLSRTTWPGTRAPTRAGAPHSCFGGRVQGIWGWLLRLNRRRRRATPLALPERLAVPRRLVCLVLAALLAAGGRWGGPRDRLTHDVHFLSFYVEQLVISLHPEGAVLVETKMSNGPNSRGDPTQLRRTKDTGRSTITAHSNSLIYVPIRIWLYILDKKINASIGCGSLDALRPPIRRALHPSTDST